MEHSIEGSQLHRETQNFLKSFKTLLISTVSMKGVPNASYAPFVRVGNSFYVYTSQLAKHTLNLELTRKVSVLFIENEQNVDQLFARKRLIFDCLADIIDRGSETWIQTIDIFEEKFGAFIEVIRSLQDFKMFCITPKSGLYVKGFGKAYRISGRELNSFQHITDSRENMIFGSKPLLEDAIALASHLHKGQKDKAGVGYILHPLRVMLDSTITTEDELIVAVLHDVVEDCDITPSQLRELGYSEKIVEALGFLTKLPEEEDAYDAFIERIRFGPALARKIKLADLRDNSDLSRIAQPNERDMRRQQKYHRAIAILEAAQ